MALPARRQSSAPALPHNAQLELAQLERDLGGRQALVQALTFAKQSKDVRYLLGLIADPENNSRSLADICRSGRILPGELIAALASGAELRSQLLAKQHIARGIPSVVGEVMQKAAQYEDDCTECGGLGELTSEPSEGNPNPTPQKCDICKGTGRLRYDADPKCRDLALEMAGLTGKGGGISVTTNVAVAQVGGSYEGFERMQEAMDQVLYGSGAVPDTQPESAAEDTPTEAIDATVVSRAEGTDVP